MRYGYTALALNSDNYIKTIEATHSAKPTIMTPPQSFKPPTPRPGYKLTTLPTWCSINQTCNAVITKEYESRMRQYLPSQQRDDIVIDSSTTYLY